MGVTLTLVIVVAMIVLPTMIDSDEDTRDVGLAGAVPAGLEQALSDQGEAVGVDVRVTGFDQVPAAEETLRDGGVDVLVVDGQRLEWEGAADEQLKAVVTGSLQLLVVQQRARAASIDPRDMATVMAPVEVDNVELGAVTGHGPEDSAAAIVMTGLLLMAISIYGNLVLTGVAEEKASRVVEVLLVRIPARSLLTGKVLGIGLLGFGQFVVTAVAAFVTGLFVDAIDIPAVSGDVLAWVVIWFVLGFALYAMAYGALGSLASRTEDAQSVAGPVVYVLLAAYFASFVAIDEDPDGLVARLLSYVPLSAPLAMPGRVALGATAWWEPVLAAALALVALGWLAVVAGRVYANAILQSGPSLHLRDVWRSRAVGVRR
jgi:ABC-2 type transport system permease protein